MLDRLFDVLLQFAGLFCFWAVVDEGSRGVVLRLGKPKRKVGAGFHWKLPMNLESVYTCEVTPYTERLAPQSLHTQDSDDPFTIRAMVTWQVRDELKYLFGVAEGSDAILDVVAGAIGSAVQNCNSDDVRSGRARKAALTAAKRKAAAWGLTVLDLQFCDVVQAPTYRLITEGLTGDS